MASRKFPARRAGDATPTPRKIVRSGATLDARAILLLTSAVYDGTATENDALLLIEQFCRLSSSGFIAAREPVAQHLLDHVRLSLQAFLDDEARTIESALGLTRKLGRPKASAARNEADESLRFQMAREVVRHRLDMPHQDALKTVARKFGWGTTIVGKAFRQYWREGIAALEAERGPLSPDQRKRIASRRRSPILRHETR